MATQTVSHLLGSLQDDPDNEEALARLAELANGSIDQDEARLLDKARQVHDSRAEYAAVAHLLDLEARLAQSDPDRAAELLKELGRVCREELLDDERAATAYRRALELRPGDADIQDALQSIQQTASKWSDIVQRFLDEASHASDASLKTSLLVSAASLVWKYKKKGRDKQVDALFKDALAASGGDARAARLYEQVLRRRNRWEDLAQVLLQTAEHAKSRDEKVPLYLRAARVLARRLNERARAASCYERVLDFAPGHAEAMTFLAAFFTDTEQWDHLVALYEDALRSRTKLEDEAGVLLQLGMVHWRFRNSTSEAEPFFARLRKLDPAHPGMLSFYREQFAKEPDRQRWVTFLTDAQRVASTDVQRRDLAIELARAAEQSAGGTEKAIDAWKAVLRLDPTIDAAPEALKALYEKTGKWNALVELLKSEADAVGDSQPERKAALLRHLVPIYRDKLGLDVMVINTFNAILQLVPSDREALDALGAAFESTGRWNDLIQVLTRKAEAVDDPTEKVALYLRVATLWVERFANYNQATAPLERVVEIEPNHREALAQLKEIYRKKRAWSHLYDVLLKEARLASDPTARLEHKVEIAKLAGERLHRHADAIAMWKEVLEESPEHAEAVDALEKLAEREKDWPTLAEVLERRAAAGDEKERVKLLQKLGLIYGEHMNEPARAASAWKRILDLDPKNGRALRTLRETFLASGDWAGLEALYAEQNDYEGLVEVLGGAAERTDDVSVRVQLSFRAAEIYQQHLNAPHRAFRSYERVLAVDPKNERAARALLPIYERDEKWSRLPVLLEILLEGCGNDEPGLQSRLQILDRLRRLALERLSDADAAFRYAARAFEIGPADDDVRANVEDAASRAGRADALMQLYLARLEALDPENGPDEASWLRRRIAAIAAELGETDRAVQQLSELLQVNPGDQEAAEVLEGIYRAEARHRELRALLLQRASHSADDAERRLRLMQLAALEEDVLEDAELAAARYREILEIDPTDVRALSALDRLAAAAERWDELATVLQRRREAATGDAEARELSLRLGEVRVGKLSDPRGALDAFAHVVQESPNDPRAIAGLERVAAARPELAAEVDELLEAAYDVSGSADKLAQVLQRRLAATSDPPARRELRLRLAQIQSERVGDHAASYQVLEDAFLDEPADVDLGDRLVEAADRAGRHEALAQAFSTALDAGNLSELERASLAGRIAQIYDVVLGRPDEAEPFHRRVIASNPLDEEAFDALKELYTNAERWADLQILYRNRIAETHDPDAKLDLLLQVCFLFEELIDDPELAIRAYQDVLDLDPTHAASRRALERLFERTGRWRDLVALLSQELDGANPDEQIGLTQRLGVLHEKRLNEPAIAVDHYERVLSLDVNHKYAREALERLLPNAGQRQRVARILEPIYEDRADWADLVQVLEVQLEEVGSPSERVALLTRIADLQENRLHDPQAAFQSVARAVEADPADASVRGELERLARLRDAERERAGVLSRAVAASESSPALQSELLLELARVWDERVGDVDQAEQAYQLLIEIDGDNPDVVLTASRALERIHLGRGDHAALAIDLRRQVQFETDQDDRRRLLVRLADLLEEVLEDRDGAIAAHRERLDLDPGDADALRALERLYEQRGDWERLIGVLQARDSVVTDADEQREIARRIGGIYEEKLESIDNAIAAYNDVLSRFGRDVETLAALTRLYERSEKWDDLLEVLDMVHELAEHGGQRATIRFHMAELMRTRTGDLPRAIELYSEVLELVPDHPGALDALESVMQGGEEGAEYPADARIAAARVLVPRFETTATYDKLLASLAVLAGSDDPIERYRVLRRAAEVADMGLESPERAFELMGRAIRAGIAEDDLAQLLRDYARLAQSSGRWADYVALLREVAPEILDGDLQVRTYADIAEVAREHLGDAALARRYFEQVLEQRPDEATALDALEDLTAVAGDHAALIEVLRRKTELADRPDDRVELLVRRAKIHEDAANDLAAAIDCLEQALAETHPVEAYRGLERLYGLAERWDDLVMHYERMLEAGIGEAVEIRHRLGTIQQTKLHDAWAAVESFKAALERDPSHAPTIAALEQMMQGEEHRAAAAEILEPVFLQRMDWPKVIACLEARLQPETDVDERKSLLTRLGQLHEDYLEDLDGALEAYARLFREDPRDEETWETLSRLARVLEKWTRLAEIYRGALEEITVDDPATAKLALTAGQLFDQKANDLSAAAELYARALRFEPSDHGAFASLESVYQRQEAWPRLLDLYREQAEVAEGDADRIALLRKSARLLEERLNEPDRAVEAYRDILMIDAADPNAVEALDALLVKRERWSDLVDHLRHQIELEGGETPEALDLRHRLAGLLADKLDDKAAAIETYGEVVRIDPHHIASVQALEQLVQDPDHQLRIIEILEPIYLATDQWRKRIAVYEAQVALTQDPVDSVRLLQEVARLHEERSGDLNLAFHAYARAFALDPNDAEVRAEVDRLAGQLGTWDTHIGAYEQALAHSDDPTTKASLLATMARVHDEKRGDPRAAIVTYERLLENDPDDPSPLDSLEALHTMVGDWRGLVDVLGRKVQRSYDPMERGEILRRAGSVLEELLGDRPAAIEAYRQALVEDERDVIALESLDRLYSSAGEHQELAEVLRRRIELEEDTSLRVEVGVRLGMVNEEQLGRPEDAIEAYQRVLEDEPGQPDAIVALSRLYERQAMWPELLENLKLQAATAEGAAKVALLHRAGEVLEREMDYVLDALPMYEEVLQIEPGHEPSIQALMRIAKLEDYRVQATEVLEPLLRNQQRWDELASLLAARADATSDPADKLVELRRLAEVHELGRHDTDAAFEAYRRALAEDPSDEATANDIERLAAVLGAWDRAADAFAARASSVLDPEIGRALYGRLARIAEEKLNDDVRAIEAHSRALDQSADDPEALSALDRLFTKTASWPDLGQVLERRVAAANDPTERADLLVRLGTLKLEQFADRRAAFRAFQEVLDRDPSEPRATAALEALLEDEELAPEVVEVLEPVYRQTGAMEKVAALFDVRIPLAQTDGERVRLLQDQAAVLEQDLADPARALDALRRAFELDPRDEGLLSDLERLAPVAQGWAALRGMVEKVVESGSLDRMVVRDLNLRAARWYRDQLSDPDAAQERYRAALAADPEAQDAHEQLVELLRASQRGRELVAALVAWAEVEYDETSRKERLREAAVLAESTLADSELAASCYRKILETDPSDAFALEELVRIEAAAGRHDEVARLLERRIEVETDPNVRLVLRKQLARTHHKARGDVDAAIDAWRAALDEEPTDLECISALEELYERAERWGEVEELVQRRLDIAETQADRIAARVRLARLAESRFGRRKEAIDQLQEILQEDPGNGEALDELERLVAADERWEELVELLERRAQDARASGDGARELAVLVRLGAVHRDRLGDAERAIAIFQRVLEREPGHLEALGALVALHRGRSDWAAAVGTLERLAALRQGADAIAAWNEIADVVSERLEDPDRAERALRAVFDLDRSARGARDRLKAHYEKHGKADLLVEMLDLDEKETQDVAKKVEILKRIADLQAGPLGDPGRAARCLERASALAPEDRSVLLPLCDFYVAAGRQADAIPVLEKIVASYGTRRNKEVAIYHHRLGRAKESMGDLDGAMESYDAAFKVDLTNVLVLRDLGRLCMTRGDFDRAQKTFRALLLQKLSPDDGIGKADVYFYLGDICARQNDPKKAISMLERAIAEDSKHAEAAALLAQLKG